MPSIERLTSIGCALAAVFSHVPAQAQPVNGWRTLSDSSKVAFIEAGSNLRSFRCKQLPDGSQRCLVMDSVNDFGIIYLATFRTLPTASAKPSSGYKCLVEPRASYSQELFDGVAGSLLKNQHNFPERRFPSNRVPWTREEVFSQAQSNGLAMQADYFDCHVVYEFATANGGVRALFTTAYSF